MKYMTASKLLLVSIDLSAVALVVLTVSSTRNVSHE